MQRIFPVNPFDRPAQQAAPNRFNRPAQPQQPKDVWQQDAGGATDGTILGLRRRAAKSMQRATDMSPVQHWTQGAARLAEGFKNIPQSDSKRNATHKLFLDKGAEEDPCDA